MGDEHKRGRGGIGCKIGEARDHDLVIDRAIGILRVVHGVDKLVDADLVLATVVQPRIHGHQRPLEIRTRIRPHRRQRRPR